MFMESVPVQGKTYSLFDENGTTETYYYQINKLAEYYINKFDSASLLLTKIQQLSKNKRKLNQYVKYNSPSENSKLVCDLYKTFHSYTIATKQHLRSLPFWKFRDHRLSTTETQYHLYMLEIELFNRINKFQFLNSDYKIALLPHCLRGIFLKIVNQKKKDLMWFVKDVRRSVS